MPSHADDYRLVNGSSCFSKRLQTVIWIMIQYQEPLVTLLATQDGWQSAVQYASVTGGTLLQYCLLPSEPCVDSPCGAIASHLDP